METNSRSAFAGILLSSIFLILSCPAPAAMNPKPYTGKGLAPAYLRCEYLVDPLGIDEPAPRLSWVVESGERGQRQTAYRLLVASSEKLLRRGQGDLWDTGKAASDETICAVYQGQPLVSRQRCYWMVKVWDKDGRESTWSKPAIWSMGLLQPGDWKADWIGHDCLARRLRPRPHSTKPSGFRTPRTRRAMCPSASGCSTTP